MSVYRLAFILFSSFVFIAIICLYSCSHHPDTKNEYFDPGYALYIMNKQGANSFLLTESLHPDAPTVEIPVPILDFNREFIQKEGHFYHVNPESNFFIQYKLSENKKLVAVDSIKLGNGYLENFHWKDQSDTLLLFTVERDTKDRGLLYMLDTKPFSLIRKEILPLPSAIHDFNLLNIGLVDFADNTLWIAYSYSKYLKNKDYTTSDTMYYATLDFKSLNLLKIQKDNRSTYPGGINTVQTYSAKNEKNDLYFMSCPGIALGNNLDMPTAIFRKKNGSDLVDPDYMINVSEKIKNHAYGFWYLGGQRAIIRSEQKEKYTDFSNHHSTYQFEYYIVHLDNDTFQKLDLPLDKGTRKENVIIKDNFVFFAIDDEENQHAIWQYNIDSGEIKKTLKSTKSTDYIVRLDNLK